MGWAPRILPSAAPPPRPRRARPGPGALAPVAQSPPGRAGALNAKERVRATLQRQPVDRTPIDCWLYQKQFVEQLAAAYGPREQFLDEFGIDIFVGFLPWPNQMGRRLTLDELAAAVEIGRAHV